MTAIELKMVERWVKWGRIRATRICDSCGLVHQFARAPEPRGPFMCLGCYAAATRCKVCGEPAEDAYCDAHSDLA